jgi:hypothetical protein
MANNSIDANVGNRVWTKFVLIEDGKPSRISDAPLYFRTSTGLRPTDEWLAQDGYRGFIDSIPPTNYNKYMQKAVKTPLQNLAIDPENNTVTQTWSIVDLTDSEKMDMIDALKDDINELRDRKIVAGCMITLTGISTPLQVGGTQDNIRNISNLAQMAMYQSSMGITTAVPFRDDKNVIYNLTPSQIIEMWQKSMQYISSLYQASWNLKDSNPVPLDFASQKYWPNTEV